MKRVQLVVTGRCEQLALHESLALRFPSAEFPRPVKVESFTSSVLTEPPQRGVVETVHKFAAKLVELVDESDPGCLVIGVDDREFGVPERQVAVVREQVLRVLDAPPSLSRRDRLAQSVAARCSFHLLVPMVEAYFFGDPQALSRAGATRPSRFDSTICDVEAFVVADPEFTAPPDSKDGDDWCRAGARRAQHPKLYLKFLSGSGEPGAWRYRESRHGAEALRTLDWKSVCANASHGRFAQALMADIADWLELPLSGMPSPVTWPTSLRQRVLRNA